YISTLFTWVNGILSYRESIKPNKNNIELEITEYFQMFCELLYHSNIFHSIILNIYSRVDDSDGIIYYLDKVSVRIRSLDLISKLLEEQTFNYADIYINIQWYFIEPTEYIVDLIETPSA
ncbi:unnamed protein product, partial [Rotaria sp. Silwood1]